MECRTSSKIIDLRAVPGHMRLLTWEKSGKFVFTTGAFDCLHDGHVRYLEDAAALGCYLLVAVDSDERVRSQKGPDRPAYGEEVRLRVVAALAVVTGVFLYTDLEQAVRVVMPDIIVASPTTSFDPNMQRYDFAKELGIPVRAVASRSDTHTSDVIERIKALG